MKKEYPYRNKKWLIEQIEKHQTPNEISRQTGYPETCIRRYIDRFQLNHSIPYRKYFPRTPDYDKHPFKNKQWLIEQIEKYGTVAEICKFTSTSKTSVRRYIRYYELNDRLEKQEPYRVYDINKDYFKIVDCERKAYWLGLLMADGCVSNTDKKYSIRLALKDPDGYLPYLLSVDLNSKRKLCYSKTKKMLCANFNCKEMFFDLNKLNIVPNKTGKEAMPQIPENLIRHFVRGFFDGDGTIYRRKNRKRHKCAIGFVCQNEQFIVDIIALIEKHCGFTMNYYLHDKCVYESKTEAFNKCKFFCEWIYKDATICMIRKYEKAKEYLNICCPSLEKFKEEVRLIDGDLLRASDTNLLSEYNKGASNQSDTVKEQKIGESAAKCQVDIFNNRDIYDVLLENIQLQNVQRLL